MNIREKIKNSNISWIILVSGLILTLLITYIMMLSNHYEIEKYTNEISRNAEYEIKKRFEKYTNGLKEFKGVISAIGVDKIRRSQLEKYSNSRNMYSEFKGAMGFGFIRRVPREYENEFVERVRKDDSPNFVLRTISPHEDDRFIIEYIFPENKNRQALGLDIGSESNRRSAAILAAREGKAYLTSPITLVQKDNKSQKGALILFPVYPDDFSYITPDSRENAVLGWTYAPLIIEDVLANFEFITDNAIMKLINESDSNLFYDSSSNINHTESTYRVTKSLNILGQKWKLEINLKSNKVNKVKVWNTYFSTIIGFLTTLIILIFIYIVDNKNIENNLDDDSEILNETSIKVFLKSNQFKKFINFISLLFIFIAVVSIWFVLSDSAKKIENDLEETKNYAFSYISGISKKYQEDIYNLTKISYLDNIKEIEFNNKSKINNSIIEENINRLSDIFRVYMLSNVDVYQIRFIGVENNWRERVNLKRDSNFINILSGNDLQSKANESYIRETINIGYNNVFISDINLNREFGKLEEPKKPVWRFSSPIFYPDGKIFGIVIINLNAKNILSSLLNKKNSNIELYITNSDNDFVIHPDRFKEFSFEEGILNKWESIKISDSLYNFFDMLNLEIYRNDEKLLFIDEIVYSHLDNPLLKFYTSFEVSKYISIIFVDIFYIIIILIFMALILTSIKYWSWIREFIRYKNNKEKINKKFREKELKRFKSILDSAPDAMLVLNEFGKINMANAQCKKIFGCDSFDLEGNTVEAIIPEHLRKVYLNKFSEYLNRKDRKKVDTDIKLLAIDSGGNEFPAEVSLSTLEVDGESLVSVSVKNIRERIEIENALREALREAKSATEAKSAFLANTSHEIRTPLNAIIGLGYLLSEENLTNSQKQLVSKIQVAGKSLLGIVNDVLDLAKIEANEMVLEELSVDLPEILDEVSSIFSIQAENKGLIFELQLDQQLPKLVVTDNIRLRQVLTNLLGNALKFTANGKITLHTKVIDSKISSQEHVKIVRFTVSDTGIGIPSGSIDNLFKPFSQADSSTTRRFGGTGLGLSIVSQLVHLLGGKIGVESIENEGSNFWVEIPFRVQSIEEIAKYENKLQTIFVLIADDDPEDAKRLEDIARSLGWRSQVVGNGDELIDAYLTRQENKLRSPDAIIVDWNMPKTDGLSAMNILASKVGRDNLPAVLMVSAYNKDEIIKNDENCIIDSILVKPVDASALFNSVNEVVTSATGDSSRVLQSTKPQAVEAKWLPNICVLVVDDSPINLVVVGHILEHNGAEVQTANSGEEALKLLESPNSDYDAVLMDVQMPGIDGLETTQLIRNRLQLITLPIIALTAGALLEEKNNAIDAGMNDFLTKPIDPSKLINVLRRSIESYRGKTMAIEPLYLGNDNAESWPEIKGIDLSLAKSLLLGDKELFFKTLEGLLNDYYNLESPTPLKNIDDIENTYIKYTSQIHKLRSTAGMIGAVQLKQCADKAEKVLRDRGPSVDNILLELSRHIKNLRQESIKILNDWHEEIDNLPIVESRYEHISQDILQEILTLLAEQDLSAQDKIEEFNLSFRSLLGEERYKKMQEHILKLNYKEVINLLEPLIDS